MLTEYQKKLYDMRYRQKLMPGVIANMLGVNVHSVKSMIRSAKKQIEMEERYKNIEPIGGSCAIRSKTKSLD